VCFGRARWKCVDLWSFCIVCGERDGIQDWGRGTVPASILALAELVEIPKERSFQAPFIARELA
jgi:hypothetical protein